MTIPDDESLANDNDLEHNDLVIKFIFITKVLSQDMAGCEMAVTGKFPGICGKCSRRK